MDEDRRSPRSEAVTDSPLAGRIIEQFSGRGDRSDIWRGFDAFLDTDAFLNLGYSPGYHTHLVGSPQDRLAKRVQSELVSQVFPKNDEPAQTGRLLDVGCGRGGPTRTLASGTGFDSVGIDLVPYNVAMAKKNRQSTGETGVTGNSEPGGNPSFVVGDTTQLPFASETFRALVAIDSLVYVPNIERAFSELSRVCTADGGGVITDLVVDSDSVDGSFTDTSAVIDPETETASAGNTDLSPDSNTNAGSSENSDAASPLSTDAASHGDVNAPTPVDPMAFEKFSLEWDMPPLRSRATVLSALSDAGFQVHRVVDLTPNSVGHFRKWTRLYLRVANGPAGGLLRRMLQWAGFDPEVVTDQVRAAHDVLPALRHVLVSFHR